MNDIKKHTIIIDTENTPGVLYRITNLFLKRKINIESLTVSETEKKGISHFIITINETRETVEKVMKQLDRIIEVLKTELIENKKHSLENLVFSAPFFIFNKF